MEQLNWDEIVVGEEFGPLEYTITDEMVAGFATAVQDFGSWYLDDSPFGGRVAHPTMTATDYHAMLWDKKGSWVGVQTKHESEFINPAKLGKQVKTTGRIVDKFEKRGRKYIVFEYVSLDEDDTPLVRHRFTTTID